MKRSNVSDDELEQVPVSKFVDALEGPRISALNDVIQAAGTGDEPPSMEEVEELDKRKIKTQGDLAGIILEIFGKLAAFYRRVVGGQSKPQ